MKRRPVLRLGRGLELPFEAVTQTFAVLGKRGSGKTNLGVVLVEEMIPAGLPVVVVDPVGVWWGLRARANGRDPGLPIIILGGEHADAPLEPTSGAVIADFVVEAGKPCVLDVSAMRKGEQTRFMTDFAERLYHRKAKHRDPLHLVVDECDSFAPQRAMPDQARLLGAMEDLVRRGRSRGIGLTMITQRPAVLNKNVLTQAEVLVVFQLTAPQDRDAIAEWVRANADTSRRGVLDDALPGLPQGDAFVWSPSWLQIFKRTHVRARWTFDSSKTPEAGKQLAAPRMLAAVDIEALKARIAATIERAKAEDPRTLRARVHALEEELRAAKAPAPVKVERVEIPVLGDHELARLEKTARALAPVVETLASTVRSVVEALARVRGTAPAAAPVAPVFRTKQGHPTPPPPSAHPLPAGRPKRGAPPSSDAPALPSGALRMLETLARRYPLKVTRAQLGTLSGFTPSGGTFRTYYGAITRAGYIVERDNIIELTAAGLERGGGAGAPPRAEEVIDTWRRALRTGERRMLDVLIEAHPEVLSMADLGERSGFEVAGGTFRTYLGTLRRNGLADVERGTVRAGEALYLGT